MRFIIWWCPVSVVEDDTRYDRGETEARRYLLYANASYLPVSVFITLHSSPGPGYQMSGLGFLLICRGRSSANICFIFHSFGCSSSVTPPLSPWEHGGRNRRKSRVIIYHFYGRVSSGRHFLKIIPGST